MLPRNLEFERKVLRDQGIDFPGGELIAVIEGYVFRVVEHGRAYAHTVYPGFKLETIQAYQSLTNNLARTINGRSAILESADKKDILKFTWQVVTIDSVDLIREAPHTVSEFIEGPTVHEEILNRQGFFSSFRSTTPIENRLLDFSEEFNTLMGSSAIFLNTENGKLQSRRSGNVWFITDVCQFVSWLNKG